MNMANKRKKYSAAEKVRLLRLHLIEKELVSDICLLYCILSPASYYTVFLLLNYAKQIQSQVR